MSGKVEQVARAITDALHGMLKCEPNSGAMAAVAVAAIEAMREPVNHHDEIVAHLKDIQKIIADGAASNGFTPTIGDWADRLFTSQQRTSALLSKVSK